jgi:hypothetical protein
MEKKKVILHFGIGFLLYYTASSLAYLLDAFFEIGLLFCDTAPLTIVFTKEVVNFLSTLLFIYIGISYFMNKSINHNTLIVLGGFFFFTQVIQMLFTYYGVDLLTEYFSIDFDSLNPIKYELYQKYYLFLFYYFKILVVIFMFYYFSK